MLILVDSKIDDECLSILSKCHIPKLTYLGISSCGITDIGVSHICNGMAKIKITLFTYISNNLDNNKITSKGFQQIGSSNF